MAIAEASRKKIEDSVLLADADRSSIASGSDQPGAARNPPMSVWQRIRSFRNQCRTHTVGHIQVTDWLAAPALLLLHQQARIVLSDAGATSLDIELVDAGELGHFNFQSQ